MGLKPRTWGDYCFFKQFHDYRGDLLLSDIKPFGVETMRFLIFEEVTKPSTYGYVISAWADGDLSVFWCGGWRKGEELAMRPFEFSDYRVVGRVPPQFHKFWKPNKNKKKAFPIVPNPSEAAPKGVTVQIDALPAHGEWTQVGLFDSGNLAIGEEARP